MSGTTDERLRRWRLVLGEAAQEGLQSERLEGVDLQMDRTLEALYDSERKGGLGASSPNVQRWLGDIRTYFPASVVQVMQKDALEKLDLKRMLTEPELLQAVEPDVHLVANLVALGKAIPERTRETARQVVRRVRQQLERRLRTKTEQAIRGALNRSTRSNRPRANEIDWDRTIRKNLRHYQREHRTIVPERLVGFGRRRPALHDLFLCIDQSGSMATSVVYSGVFAATLASIRALKTRVVAFDTEVVDLSESMHDPVELLFGVQLGGGTEISRPLAYCERRITRPHRTTLVLISDLFDGDADAMYARFASLVGRGVQVIALLALNDEGKASFDVEAAARLAGMGVPAFACTPDLFPEMMATALSRQDLTAWACRNGMHPARAKEEGA